MNILDHNNLVIFGYPRSGTKLLASILSSFGYHNYGEWYDTWTSQLIEDKIIRYDADSQKQILVRNINRPNFSRIKHLDALINRANRLSVCQKYVITIWEENLADFPFISSLHEKCLWLCPKRNRFDQLLSRIIVLYNKNPDGDVESQFIRIQIADFRRNYWKLHRIELMQDWLIQQNKGCQVQFESLIGGTFSGFNNLPYDVTTLDQHQDLYKLVVNFKEVIQWHAELEIERHNFKSQINLQ